MLRNFHVFKFFNQPVFEMRFSAVFTLALATLAIASPTGKWKPQNSNSTNYVDGSKPYTNSTAPTGNVRGNYSNPSTYAGNSRNNQTNSTKYKGSPTEGGRYVNSTAWEVKDKNSEVMRNIEGLLEMVVADVDRLASAAGGDSSRIYGNLGMHLEKRKESEENEKRDVLSVGSAAESLIIDVLGQLARLGATAGVSLLGALSSALV